MSPADRLARNVRGAFQGLGMGRAGIAAARATNRAAARGLVKVWAVEAVRNVEAAQVPGWLDVARVFFKVGQ